MRPRRRSSGVGNGWSGVGDSASEQLGDAEMREVVDRNRRLMRMRADLAIPDLDTTRLPLDLVTMRRALAGRGINLGPSLWALTGGSPPPTGEELRLVRPRVWTKAARREPVPGQLALF